MFNVPLVDVPLFIESGYLPTFYYTTLNLDRQIEVFLGIIKGRVDNILAPAGIIKKELLESEHKKAKKFHDWLFSNQENIKWYIGNQNKIKLVDDGIEIDGDVFELEDEKVIDGENKYVYFSHELAKINAEKNGKKIPKDWQKYVNILPLDEQNKIKFFTSVLGLGFNGFYDLNKKRSYNIGLTALYLSEKSFMQFSEGENPDLCAKKDIIVGDGNEKSLLYSVRCIKN